MFAVLAILIYLTSVTATTITFGGGVFNPTIPLGQRSYTGWNGIFNGCNNCVSGTLTFSTDVTSNKYRLAVQADSCSITLGSQTFTDQTVPCVLQFAGQSWVGVAWEVDFPVGSNYFQLTVQGKLWEIHQMADGVPFIASGYIQ